MHGYNTILGVIELRLSKVSYNSVQKRYRIGRSGIALIMNRYKDSGLSSDDLRQMPASTSTVISCELISCNGFPKPPRTAIANVSL